MELKNIEDSVAKTIAITFIIILFLFAFTWIVFDFQESSSSLKDTWSIVSSLFGGITTLAAAYIAFFLYKEWRVETDYDHKLQFLSKLIDHVFNIKNEISNIRAQKELLESLLTRLVIIKDNNISNEDKLLKINNDIKNRNFASISNLIKLMNETEKTVISLCLFDNKEESKKLLENFDELSMYVESFQAAYSKLTSSYIKYEFDQQTDELIEQAFFCSNLFYRLRDSIDFENIERIKNFIIRRLTDSLTSIIDEIFKLKRTGNCSES